MLVTLTGMLMDTTAVMTTVTMMVGTLVEVVPITQATLLDNLPLKRPLITLVMLTEMLMDTIVVTTMVRPTATNLDTMMVCKTVTISVTRKDTTDYRLAKQRS